MLSKIPAKQLNGSTSTSAVPAVRLRVGAVDLKGQL